MNKEELLIKDFTYDLPEDRIAKYPLPERDESRLLVYRDGQCSESQYKYIDEFLPADSLLVFNNTKVVEVRLLFTKSTGSTIELFCLEPPEEYIDITSAMMQRSHVRWKCLVGGAKKWKDEVLTLTKSYGKELVLSAVKLAHLGDSFLIGFSWNDASLCFAEILHLFGNIPLPPYLNRNTEETDKDRYQTIYAKSDGSVAAPTAGLHFTETVFSKLKEKGIETDFVTLHVGAGTFQPVKTERIAGHRMHSEFIETDTGLIKNLLGYLSRHIISVGTTSLRTLESLYWLGVKVKLQATIPADELYLSQWEVYELPQDVTAADALEALLGWMEANALQKLVTRTQIIIVPGYELRIAHALITNFHQPQSTLLLLIASLVGDDWKKIYGYALEKGFRFLSYGDGSLLWKKE